MFEARRRSLSAVVCALALGVSIVAAHGGRAAACSCVGPRPRFLSPHAANAPLNSHARVEVPNDYAKRTFVLRAHRGAVVPTRVATIAGAELTVVDLAPTSALAPETRYEIAAVDANLHPSTLVIGTFVTGTSSDVVAPLLPSLGTVRTNLNLGPSAGGMCTVRGPWITVAKSVAQDPNRADAELGFYVWKLAPGAAYDARKPPDALVFPFRDAISIGKTSMCDTHEIELSGASVDLVLAAVDEAGNRSPTRRAHVDLTRPTP